PQKVFRRLRGPRLDRAASYSSTSELRTTVGSPAIIRFGMERTLPPHGTPIFLSSTRTIKKRRAGSGQSVLGPGAQARRAFELAMLKEAAAGSLVARSHFDRPTEQSSTGSGLTSI